MGRGAYFFRGFPWVAVTVALWMLAAALLLLDLSGRVASRGGLSALIGAAFGAALIASYTLVFRAAIRRAARQFEFRLDETSLLRQMRGHPDLRIELAAVTAVRDDPGFLTATAGDPPSHMVIPKVAEGYDAIREALAARRPIVRVSRRHLWKPAALLAAGAVCWILVVSSSHLAVVIAAAVMGLVVLAVGSRPLMAVARRMRRRRWAVWMFIAIGWLGALALIAFSLASL